MSFPKAKPQIMSDAIMYHNEARIKMAHPFARQPGEAFIGIPHEKIPIDQGEFKFEDSLNKARTLLVTQPTGFSHTGSHIGVNYKQPPIDPKYNLAKYGNTRPQYLTITSSKSNLLH